MTTEQMDWLDDERAGKHKPVIDLAAATGTPAQHIMRQEMEREKSQAAATLSREGQIQRRAEQLIETLVIQSDLTLTMQQWHKVRELVRQGIRLGIDLERDL